MSKHQYDIVIRCIILMSYIIETKSMKKELVLVLATDSFKESMTAKEACNAMERGAKKSES